MSDESSSGESRVLRRRGGARGDSDPPTLLEGSAKIGDTKLESLKKSYTFEILFIKNIDAPTAKVQLSVALKSTF